MAYLTPSLESLYRLGPPISAERSMGSGTVVRLTDDVMLCVVYLGFPEPGNDEAMAPKGTGFLLSHDGTTYLVTAAHVVKPDFEGVPFGVRMNDKNGAARVERIDEAQWCFHPDSKIDVAVIPFDVPEWSSAEPFRKWFVTDFKRSTKHFGAGDLVNIVGAFKFLTGTKRNLPAVHSGYVAAMADGEPIPTADWRAPD